MKKKVMCAIFIVSVLILIAPTVIAADTEIVIKTVPFANVNINILDPNSDSFTLLKNFNQDADNYGDLSFIFSSDKPKFDLTIYVKKNDKKVGDARAENNVVGEDLYFEVVPEGFELLYRPEEEANETEESNETVVNETVVENITEEVIEEPQEEEVTPGITGAATSGEEGSFFSNNILYFGLGLVVLIIVFFMGAVVSKKRVGSSSKEIKVRKLSDLKKDKKEQKDKKEKLSDYKQAIEDAEKKIDDAQKEIKKLKNVDKISEIKKRMIEDQKELLKLRGGEDKDD
jgi:hypothetical protein